jgi:hypothetical protein
MAMWIRRRQGTPYLYDMDSSLARQIAEKFTAIEFRLTTIQNIILANVRQPEMNRADLMALVAACRTGAQRIRELCERFGTDVYIAGTQALLDGARNRDAGRRRRHLIRDAEAGGWVELGRRRIGGNDDEFAKVVGH